ncbi:SgcJ/EcaC family oxidoreductase [Actinomadura sp. KC216]|uniref:SgcJ/EcaC family oxidoreductase n=1 Tax=Actinomadura sp. KC216 TaxID=2530370 RepID=UPI0010533F0F|nr:SgcJ/EcaC family oxidoreductase [Actinomadura sp. KC216]TDB84472.1 SgcJ/EcaC family oxidoreductase [Actinomadura sp. KC216]
MTNDILVVGDIAPETQAAVTGVVKALEKAFNAKDPIALSEQFAKKTSWTNAMGTRLDGRESIAEFSAPAMKGFLRDSYARYDVVKLMEIAPEVIAVNVVQTPTDRSGNSIESAHGATLYVIAERTDGWKIVAGQNTAVEAPSTR